MSWGNKLKGICIIILGLAYFAYVGGPFFSAWTLGYENRESGIIMEIFGPIMYVVGSFIFVSPLPISLFAGWTLMTKPNVQASGDKTQ